MIWALWSLSYMMADCPDVVASQAIFFKFIHCQGNNNSLQSNSLRNMVIACLLSQFLVLLAEEGI